MRLLRKVAAPVMLCLILGATAASASEGPSVTARREAGGVARILGSLQAFLKAVWDYEGFEIDPLGRNAPGDSGDEGYQIDPLG